ncbi:hypothetical protein [Streptomyces mirabilis]
MGATAWSRTVSTSGVFSEVLEGEDAVERIRTGGVLVRQGG